jgi:hypothetical protein
MLRTWKKCELGYTFTIDENEQGNYEYGVYILVIKLRGNVCWKVYKNKFHINKNPYNPHNLKLLGYKKEQAPWP